MIDFKAAYSGITFAKEALKYTLDQKVDDKVRVKVGEALDKIGKVQDDLFQIREDLLRLQEENHELKEEMRAKESWEKIFQEYELQKTEGGSALYLFKGMPRHFACPACVVKKEIQILQQKNIAYYKCPSCNQEYKIMKDQDAIKVALSGNY